MPTDRLARFRSWPSGVYTDELAKLWRETNPLTTRTLDLEEGGVGTTTSGSEQRVAVICHVFYTDLLDDLAALFVNLPVDTDYFVSVVDDRDREIVLSRLDSLVSGRVDVRVVENRGRDIAPKYVAFADVYRRPYDLLLFLHTKKSTYREVGTPWRQHLFDELAGTKERVSAVLEAFEREPELGVVAPPHYAAVAEYTTWQGSFLYAARLARRMNVQVTRWAPPDFATGSMFWARPSALAPITSLGLQLSDFPPEARQVTATNMHALERLVFVAAEHAGLRSVLIRSRDGVAGGTSDGSKAGRPPARTWLRAVPPTLRKMRADIALRQERFSPRRVAPLLARRAADRIKSSGGTGR